MSNSLSSINLASYIKDAKSHILTPEKIMEMQRKNIKEFKEKINYQENGLMGTILGSSGVGKTALLKDDFITKNIGKPTELEPIIVPEIITRPNLNIFDQSGNSKFHSYIGDNIDFVIFMYNATDEQSFKDLETKWLPILTKKYVEGKKVPELQYLFESCFGGERVISQEQAMELAEKYNLKFRIANNENLCNIYCEYKDTPEKQELRKQREESRFNPEPKKLTIREQIRNQVIDEETKKATSEITPDVVKSFAEQICKFKSGEIKDLSFMDLIPKPKTSKEDFEKRVKELEDEYELVNGPIPE